MKEKTSKHIPFVKMQAAGNDFVLIDNRSNMLSKDEIIDLTPTICDRKFGVGADGIMALLAPEKDSVDYTMFYRNPDGSSAGMCGNGARCIARFAESLGFDDQHSFNVHDNVYRAHVRDKKAIVISFPMQASVEEKTITNKEYYFINTGTEHLVLPVEENALENEKQLIKQGRKLRHHEKFKPSGTNVNFIYGTNATQLQLQTYERGVEDLTLACGTGAIASALVWHHLQNHPSPSGQFSVHTKGGTLSVHFSFDTTNRHYHNIKLEGPAHFVFKGTFLQ